MEVKRMAAAALALLLCAAGLSAQSFNMTLQAQRDDYTGSYSDIWGYTAPGGAEYAIIGHFGGTIFYNITDPQNPVEVGYITGPNSSWRDIKTYQEYAYITTEGTGAGTGLQIVSLADPENPQLVNTYDDKFDSAHNLFINTDRGYAYVCGTDKGTHILDLSDPINPVQVKIWGAIAHYYIHDLMVANDTIWAGAIYEGRIHAIAVPDSGPPVEVLSWTYAGAASHAGWIAPDPQYFISSDETSNGHIRIWDRSDPQNIFQVSDYKVGSGTSVHNVFVKGNLAYISYYTEGVRVLDMGDPLNPVEVGYYDTHAGGGLYAGNWGVFPYFPSGRIVASDMSKGLFVLDFDISVGVDAPLEFVPLTSARLLQNRPNPFNPRTEIGFEAGEAGPYRLEIFDVRGRVVRTLFRGNAAAGQQQLVWDGTDGGGRPVASGSYYYRLTGPNTNEKKKMVLIR